MTTPIILVYLLVASYLVIERLLRKGQAAKNLQPGQSDRGSSRLLWTIGLISLMLIVLAPLLNHHGIGVWHNRYAAWFGIFLMLIGVAMRYVAAKTLGQYYTRTLQILDDHQIVDQGLYHYIRHPGYLGVSLLDIGAGFAVENWAILLFIAIAGLASKLYRIQSEESMLTEQFGEAYKLYSAKTSRLIPLIY